MIKAVIFDCFGVLTGDNWLIFTQENFKDNPAAKKIAQDLNRQYDNGKINLEQFLDTVCELTGADLHKTFYHQDNEPPNTILFNYIKNVLKPQYKIGLLSNTGENKLAEIFTPEQNTLFDEIVLSCEVGYSKPLPEIFSAILGKLQVAPNEAVFIDDQPKNVQGATDFGINAIRYESTEQAIAELESIFSKK